MSQPRQRGEPYDEDGMAPATISLWKIAWAFLWDVVISPLFEAWEQGVPLAGRIGIPLLMILLILKLFFGDVTSVLNHAEDETVDSGVGSSAPR